MIKMTVCVLCMGTLGLCETDWKKHKERFGLGKVQNEKVSIDYTEEEMKTMI